jgi:arginase
LQEAGVNVTTAEQIRAGEALLPALEALRTRLERLYLHIDLDVLDPTSTPANSYAARVPNGLTVEQVEIAIRLIGERFQICAAGIASFDPNYDLNGQTLQAGLRIIQRIVETIRA